MADGLSLPSPLALLKYIEGDQPTPLESAKLALSRQNVAISEANYRLSVLREMRQQREFELNQRRQTVFSTMKLLTEGYQNSKSATMRQHYLNSMRRYGKFLSPLEQAGFEPFLQAGPLSPMAERENEFMLQYGNGPVVTQDRANLYKDNPRLAAIDAFKIQDFDRFRTKFISGIDTPQTNFITLSSKDDIYGIRDDKGIVQIVTGRDLALQELSEKYDIPISKIEGSGGIIDIPGSESVLSVGGRESRYVKTLDIRNRNEQWRKLGEPEVKESFTERLISQKIPEEKLPEPVQTFMEDWLTRSDDEKARPGQKIAYGMAKVIEDEYDKMERARNPVYPRLWSIQDQLQRTYPGYFFEFVPNTLKEKGFWSNFANLFLTVGGYFEPLGDFSADRDWIITPIKATAKIEPSKEFKSQFMVKTTPDSKEEIPINLYYYEPEDYFITHENVKVSRQWIKDHFTESSLKELMKLIGPF